MIQKLSKVTVADGTGVGWLQTIHIYRGSWRRYAHISDYIKMSVRFITKYPRKIRGKRYKPIRVGFRCRGMVTLLLKNKLFYDRSSLRVFQSSVLLLKKKGAFKSKSVFGPAIRNIRRKHYHENFNYFI